MAIPSLGTGRRMQEILELCNQTHCHTRMLSEPTDTDQSAEESTPFIRELNISDFLSRDEVELDTDSIAGYLSGKVVMVTGGGGSIGSELCRQIMRFKPKLLIIFEIYENCAYELSMICVSATAKTAGDHADRLDPRQAPPGRSI